jgi:hypothetical protein
MKKARSKILLSILILPAYFFLSVLNTEGALLCFGRDGHIAIEFVQACSGRDSGSGFAETDQKNACGPCTDVYFTTDSAHLKNNTLNEVSPCIGLSDNVLMTSVSVDDAHHNMPARFLRPFDKILTNLKSIVLLI